MTATKKELTKEQKYHILCKQLLSGIKQVDSRGGLERVMKAFAEFPLENNKPRLLSPNEWLLFGLIIELIDTKIEVMTELTKDLLEKQAKLTQEGENKDGNNGQNPEENHNVTEGMAQDRDITQG